jgi:hypothetical protein
VNVTVLPTGTVAPLKLNVTKVSLLATAGAEKVRVCGVPMIVPLYALSRAVKVTVYDPAVLAP